jgi:hypothetical protein
METVFLGVRYGAGAQRAFCTCAPMLTMMAGHVAGVPFLLRNRNLSGWVKLPPASEMAAPYLP